MRKTVQQVQRDHGIEPGKRNCSLLEQSNKAVYKQYAFWFSWSSDSHFHQHYLAKYVPKLILI